MVQIHSPRPPYDRDSRDIERSSERCRSGNGRGCNPRAHLECRWFESITLHHTRSPADAIGSRDSLKRRMFLVRVQGGIPDRARLGELANPPALEAVDSRFESEAGHQIRMVGRMAIAPVLKTEMLCEPRYEGSNPSPSAIRKTAREVRGQTAKLRPVRDGRIGSIPMSSATYCHSPVSICMASLRTLLGVWRAHLLFIIPFAASAHRSSRIEANVRLNPSIPFRPS